MAFTYSGDPASSELDHLRFVIGDTDENTAILTDAEINYIIANKTSDNDAIAQAFRAAATILGSKLVKRTLGPQTEDATKRHEYYLSQAAHYETLGRYAGTPPTTSYQADLVFEKDMMANES